MNYYSKLYHLARKWLPIFFLLMRILNQVVNIVSKVVNYVCQISKFRICKVA